MRPVLFIVFLCLVGLTFHSGDILADPVITLDSVSGLNQGGAILAERTITFWVGLDASTLTTGEYLPVIGLDFEISSPDGASWTATSIDTVPLPATYDDWYDYYVMSVFLHTIHVDGFSPDTVGFDATRFSQCTSIPAGFVGTILKIEIGPIDVAHVGRTICLDRHVYWEVTVEYAPGCVFQSQENITPGWSGPYCYTIEEEVSVAGGEPGAIPTEFTVRQNYPNPFNGETVITFSAPRAGNYSFDIFNVLGQKVHSRVIAVSSPGEQNVAIDADGMDMTASGIYFYQVSNGTESIRKKMLYLK